MSVCRLVKSARLAHKDKGVLSEQGSPGAGISRRVQGPQRPGDQTGGKRGQEETLQGSALGREQVPLGLRKQAQCQERWGPGEGWTGIRQPQELRGKEADRKAGQV